MTHEVVAAHCVRPVSDRGAGLPGIGNLIGVKSAERTGAVKPDFEAV